MLNPICVLLRVLIALVPLDTLAQDPSRDA
jgi:hypothetical protein